MDQKHPVTTRTTTSYQRGYKGRSNESEADLPSLAMVFLVLITADMVEREKSLAMTIRSLRSPSW